MVDPRESLWYDEFIEGDGYVPDDYNFLRIHVKLFETVPGVAWKSFARDQWVK